MRTARVRQLVILVGILLSARAAADEPAQSGKLSGDAYFRQLGQARDLQSARDYAAAGKLYRQLLDTCADDGEVWLQLAHCQAATEQWRDALASYEQALERGAADPDTITRRMAAASAKLGDREQAYHWLEATLARGLPDRILLRREGALASLAAEPRFRQMAAYPPPSLSRDEAWRYDLKFLVSEARRLHPELYRRTTPDALDQAAESLAGRIPQLADAEVLVEFQRIAAMFGDGHSMAPLGAKQAPMPRLPITPYWFSDGLFVVDAGAPAQEWIGCELTRVGDKPVSEALAAVTPLVSRDNEMGVKAWAPRVMMIPTVLKATGVIQDANSVPVTMRDRAGNERQVMLTPQARQGSRWLLPPRSEDGKSPPRWLRDADANFWKEYLADDATLYIQFNHVAETPRYTFAQFADEVQEFCDTHPVRAIIVDVRHNGGGNTFLYQPLLRALVYCERAERDRQLYALTSRFTFSACQNFSTDLDRLTDAVFAGEPTGSNPNSIGESTDVILPCSNIRVSISTRRWQFSYPMDHRVWIAPQIPVPLESRDYFADRDPVLEAVLRVIRGEGTAQTAAR